MELGQVGVTTFQGFGCSCSTEAAPVYRGDSLAVVQICNVRVVALTVGLLSLSLPLLQLSS